MVEYIILGLLVWFYLLTGIGLAIASAHKRKEPLYIKIGGGVILVIIWPFFLGCEIS